MESPPVCRIWVSILVLMEVKREHSLKDEQSEESRVSILVLMEVKREVNLCISFEIATGYTSQLDGVISV